MAASFIRGVQSNGVGSSIKHFALYNQETGLHSINVNASPRTIREIYLKPYEIAIRKSVPWAVMSSQNKVNGIYACESKDLLTEVLRGEWGYEGMVVNGWFGNDICAMVEAGNDMSQEQ